MYEIVKRIIDISVSVMLIFLLSPILLCIYILLYFNGGRAVFFQERLGKNKCIFTLYKFRTMVVDADNYLDDSGAPTRDRVTKIGALLRRSSLDEIPQLFNILIGDMSFVGPRPVLASWHHKFTGERNKRFELRPGITGLAQIRGRNEIPWSERVKYDLEYVSSFNLLVDAQIVVQTVRVVAFGSNIVIDRNPGSSDDL